MRARQSWAGLPAGIRSVALARRRGEAPERSTTARPVPRSEGSIPRTTPRKPRTGEVAGRAFGEAPAPTFPDLTASVQSERAERAATSR